MLPDPDVDAKLDALVTDAAAPVERAQPRDYFPVPSLTPEDIADIERLLDALVLPDDATLGNESGPAPALRSDSLGNAQALPEASSEAEKDLPGQTLSVSAPTAIFRETSLVPVPFPTPITINPTLDHHADEDHDKKAALEWVKIAKDLYPATKPKRSRLTKPIRSRRTKFSRLSDADRIAEFHRALLGSDDTHAMTLNISPEIERKARAAALKGHSPATWMLKRIRRELLIAGLPAVFWIMPEEADVDSHHAREQRRALGLPANKRLHFHGEMRLSKEDAAKARAALRKAGGVYEENRQFQAHTRHDPDAGWLRYLVKDNWKRSEWVRRLAKGQGIAGSHITGKKLYAATDELRDLAQANYDEDRGKMAYCT